MTFRRIKICKGHRFGVFYICLWCVSTLLVVFAEERCFCKLQGRIDDCTCSIDTVDHFNNVKIYPRLKSILIKDYFRYSKANLKKECPFWVDNSKCAMKDCSVQTCPEEQVPLGLKGLSSLNKYSQESHENDLCDENHGGLGAVNKTISDESYEDFERWQHHDDIQDNYCVMDEGSSADLQYVDLLLNPERFTGYSGSSAHRIWKSIYEENCFKPGDDYGPYTTSKNINAMCFEKRAFYRAVSGLHASINIHLCANYYSPSKSAFEPGIWGPNLEEFKRRFDPTLTNGEGPQRLKNLYFLYLLELRALAKAAPYLNNEVLYTGNIEEDACVKEAVTQLLDICRSFTDHFNEKIMFSGKDREVANLKKEFRDHFWNISRIMDCVGCDKCRLWGKLQVQGLGTAFKILFTSDSNTNFKASGMKNRRFQLTREEIVSLFNAFGRLSNSIFQLENFRNMMKT